MRRIVLLAFLAWPLPSTADVFGFETPSGNINCSVGMGEGPSDIICTIHQREGDPARPRPAGCDLAWGHVFMMRSRGPVTMECQDPGRNPQSFEVAPYGVQSGDWDGIRCVSRQSGLECRNADGHGFMLSRRLQQVF